MLITRSEEERAGMYERMRNEMELEHEQLQNMREAGLGEAELKRNAFIQGKHVLEEQLLEMQQKNEGHMKMMKMLLEMIAKHQREKMELRERMKERSQREIEESLKELRRRQSEEENELLKKMDIFQYDNLSRGKEDFCAEAKDDEFAKKREAVPQMMASRAQMVGDLSKRMENNEEEQESIVKMVLCGIANVSPAAGKLIALYPPARPDAEAVASGISGFADALSKVDCLIM